MRLRPEIALKPFEQSEEISAMSGLERSSVLEWQGSIPLACARARFVYFGDECRNPFRSMLPCKYLIAESTGKRLVSKFGGFVIG
jgi:hypothetical protein